ncbi:hypothetical protein MO867_21910, partial [Microbulbifer sp. OS29]
MNLCNRVRGFYTLETYRAEKTEDGLREIPGSRSRRAEFENLITDLGLNRLGDRSPASSAYFCYVGSGSSAPAQTDTDMDNFIAVHSVLQSDTRSAQASIDPWYLSTQKVNRFNQGVAAGNLSEVGMGWDSNPSGALFSRALIQDADGNPSSITVLDDEYLDVTYELRIYPNLGDFTGTITIDGVDYNYTARACRANTAAPGAWDFDFPGNNGAYSYAYAGEIGDVSGYPAGTNAGGTPALVTYNYGSLRASVQLTWALNSANFSDGVRSVAL